MEFERIRYEVEGPAATITIAREKVLNALDAATLDELEAALQRAVADAAVRGIVITGAGAKAFVAGADIQALSEVEDPSSARSLARRGQAVFAQIEASPKPVIACVNGYALGGGLELALSCHFRYASERAKLGLPEVSLGLIPGYGGTQRLVRAIGRGPAAELIVTGDPVPASEALRLGLVNQVFPLASFMDDVRAYAGDLARMISPRSMRVMKEQLYRTLTHGLGEAIEIANREMVKSFDSEDFKEGVAHFMEKRAPAFTGR